MILEDKFAIGTIIVVTLIFIVTIIKQRNEKGKDD